MRMRSNGIAKSAERAGTSYASPVCFLTTGVRAQIRNHRWIDESFLSMMDAISSRAPTEIGSTRTRYLRLKNEKVEAFRRD